MGCRTGQGILCVEDFGGEGMRFLVICCYSNNNAYGIKSAEVSFEHYPPTMKDILEVQRMISEKSELENVVIINYLPLSEENEVH